MDSPDDFETRPNFKLALDLVPPSEQFLGTYVSQTPIPLTAFSACGGIDGLRRTLLSLCPEALNAFVDSTGELLAAPVLRPIPLDDIYDDVDLDEWLQLDAERGIDTLSPPLMRVTRLHSVQLVMWTTHHAILDGVSLNAVLSRWLFNQPQPWFGRVVLKPRRQVQPEVEETANRVGLPRGDAAMWDLSHLVNEVAFEKGVSSIGAVVLTGADLDDDVVKICSEPNLALCAWAYALAHRFGVTATQLVLSGRPDEKERWGSWVHAVPVDTELEDGLDRSLQSWVEQMRHKILRSEMADGSTSEQQGLASVFNFAQIDTALLACGMIPFDVPHFPAGISIEVPKTPTPDVFPHITVTSGLGGACPAQFLADGFVNACRQLQYVTRQLGGGARAGHVPLLLPLGQFGTVNPPEPLDLHLDLLPGPWDASTPMVFASQPINAAADGFSAANPWLHAIARTLRELGNQPGATTGTPACSLPVRLLVRNFQGSMQVVDVTSEACKFWPDRRTLDEATCAALQMSGGINPPCVATLMLIKHQEVVEPGSCLQVTPLSFCVTVSTESKQLSIEVGSRRDSFINTFPLLTCEAGLHHVNRTVQHHMGLTDRKRSQPLIPRSIVLGKQLVDGPCDLVAMFEASSRLDPNATCLVQLDLDGQVELSVTWAQLNAAVSLVATKVREVIGEPGQPEKQPLICCLLQRSLALYAAQLGVLAAGCSILPMDPLVEAERQETVRRLAAPVLVIDEQWMQAVGLDVTQRPEPHDMLPQPGGENAAGEATAYVIFTSGSTGTPKGIRVLHRNAACMFRNTSGFTYAPGDVSMPTASVQFDMGLLEGLGALCRGASVIAAPPGLVADTPLLRDVIRTHGVTKLIFVATMFHNHVRNDPYFLRGVQSVAVGGDVVQPGALDAAHAACPSVTVRPGWGPTETTMASTFVPSRLPFGLREAPIGLPADGEWLAIVDANGDPVPHGVPGEIVVGGVGVTAGYVPGTYSEVDAKRFFVGTDWSRGSGDCCQFRTGDLAVLEGLRGPIRFLGRLKSDGQTKINGHRVEVGEVMKVLANCDGVDEAVVIIQNHAGDKRLVGFACVRPDSALASMDTQLAGESLVAAMAHRMPRHMVPSPIVVVARMPMTPHHKVDQKALMALLPSVDAPLRPMAAPPAVESKISRVASNQDQALVVERLRAAWGTLLNLEPASVPTDTEWSTLGGNSVHFSRLVSQGRDILRSAFGRSPPQKRLLHAITLGTWFQLADELRGPELAQPTPPDPDPKATAGLLQHQGLAATVIGIAARTQAEGDGSADAFWLQCCDLAPPPLPDTLLQVHAWRALKQREMSLVQRNRISSARLGPAHVTFVERALEALDEAGLNNPQALADLCVGVYTAAVHINPFASTRSGSQSQPATTRCSSGAETSLLRTDSEYKSTELLRSDSTAPGRAMSDPAELFRSTSLTRVISDASAGLLTPFTPVDHQGSPGGELVARQPFAARKIVTSTEKVKGRVPRNMDDVLRSESSTFAQQVAFALGVNGPTVNLEAACASSLAALHAAVADLRSGMCDVAIVGGVFLRCNAPLAQCDGMDGADVEALSEDGVLRPWDQRAKGGVTSDGAAVFVLVRSDHQLATDHGHVEVVATAQYNDAGARQMLCLPEGSSHGECLRRVLMAAGLNSRAQLGYLELSGAGTHSEDEAELDGVGQVLNKLGGPEDPVFISTPRGHFGSLDQASGSIALARACMALKRGQVPPTANHEVPHSGADNLRVATKVEDWPSSAQDGRRVAVLSHGLGGSAAAAVLRLKSPVSS